MRARQVPTQVRAPNVASTARTDPLASRRRPYRAHTKKRRIFRCGAFSPNMSEHPSHSYSRKRTEYPSRGPTRAATQRVGRLGRLVPLDSPLCGSNQPSRQ